MAKEEDTDFGSFINHKTSTFEKAEFFKWDGECTIWLRSVPRPRWVFKIPKLVEREDKQTGEKHVMLYSDRLVCPEGLVDGIYRDERVLKEQKKRDEDGNRDRPPQVCSMLKLAEWVYQEVLAKRLSWVDPIFSFSGEEYDKKKHRYEELTTTIHAGDFYDGFKDADVDEKKVLAKHGIFLSDSWKTDMRAKCEYLFSMLDHAHPENGLQIMTANVLIGDKIKSVIGNRMKVAKDKGNPLKNPYAFMIESRPNEKEFQKKYEVLWAEDVEYMSRIQKLLAAEAPSLKHLFKPYNPLEVRSFLERHCVLDKKKAVIPWDDFFKPFPVATDEQPESTPASSKHPKKVVKAIDDAGDVIVLENGIEVPNDEDLVVACDECEAPMLQEWNKCPSCGAKYKGDDLVDPPEPPKKAAAKDDAPEGKKLKGRRMVQPKAGDEEDDPLKMKID